MCSRSPFAPLAAFVLAVALMNLAAAGAAAGAMAQPADPSGDSPAGLVAVADADGERPAVVPLPPALGTGLVGLGTMAVLRVGRRMYRRR